MEQTYVTAIEIKNVRHLHDISIPLSKEKRKHLILTGKNGSGKTSVLEALVNYFERVVLVANSKREELNSIVNEEGVDSLREFSRLLSSGKNNIMTYLGSMDERDAIKVLKLAERIMPVFDELMNAITNERIEAKVSENYALLSENYKKGKYIFAYYDADRNFQVKSYQSIDNITLKKKYDLKEFPGADLAQYLAGFKARQAFTQDEEKKAAIDKWFAGIEHILQVIFEEESLKLLFNEETFQFTIQMNGREIFDFNTLSRGYSAILNIVMDLIMRMEAQQELRIDFDMEGLVVIDEIETHLHLELQRKILPVLTKLFPNIQFIVSTHSPFILNSLDDAVIYDLEKGTLVENGMKNLPYEGIVEGYFGADRLSEELRSKFEKYKLLVNKEELTDAEYAEVDELEYYLDEVPDYLAKEIATEYRRLKLEFSNRE